MRQSNDLYAHDGLLSKEGTHAIEAARRETKETTVGQERLRVLYVTPVYEPAYNAGGVVRSASESCRSLVQLGHRVTVFATNSDGHSHMAVPVNRAVDVGGVEVFYFHTDMPGFFRYSRTLRDACSTMVRAFDIVHIISFWNYPGIPAAREAVRAGVPYIVSTCGTFIPTALSSKRFRKWLYLKLFDERILRGAAAYHYTSDVERREMQCFRVQRPSFTIPNGVDLSGLASQPSREVAREMLGLGKGDFAVGFLGRLHWIKALDVLVAAVDQAVRHGHVSIRLFLAGPDDGAECQLRRLVEAKGLGGHVRFLGSIHGDAKVQFLSALDVATLASWTENFGNAAAEAMAVGVPVLVSENAGICGVVRKNKAGLVVPVDASAIEDALIWMMDNEEKRMAMGQAAQQAAWAYFERGKVASLMAAAYQDILD